MVVRLGQLKFLAAIVLAAFLLMPQAHAAKKKNDNAAKPIEITADSLEVFRDQNKAIFTGDVDAVQGDMTLKSDVMVVHYKENKGTKNKADAAMGPAGSNSIERIEAKGNVFLSTPEETAQGKTGDYNLDKKIVHLNENVILTKGKNVVKGDHLVYNLDTGHSKVWSDAEQGTSVKTSGEPQKKKQRVRSIFVPNSSGKK